MVRWSREVMGVSVAPHFHALVREWADDNKIWNFAGRRGPYRKLNTAMAACEYHEKVWRAMIQIARGEFKGRAERIRGLDGRARVGTQPFRGRVFSGLPLWVRTEASDAHRIIKGTIFGKEKDKCEFDDQQDPPEVSKTSESSSPATPESATDQEATLTVQSSGPVSSAIVEDEFSSPPTESNSQSTAKGSRKKRAKPAAAVAKEPKKPSKRSTTKKSASTESPSPTTEKATSTGAKRSRSSPAKKSKPSKDSASPSENDVA